MRGQNSISAMTVLLTLCLGSLGADPWPIQGCPGPQCVVNSLAELAANNQFHNAIDIPTPLGATVLAIQPGYFYPDWRSTAYGSCQVAFYPEGTPQENTTYMHTEALPDPYDWEAGHEVAIQDPICRVKAHDAYHHLHLGTDRGGVSRSNPLKALQPAATFTPPVIKPLTPTHNAPLLQRQIQHPQNLGMFKGLYNNRFTGKKRFFHTRVRVSPNDNINALHFLCQFHVRAQSDVRQDHHHIAFSPEFRKVFRHSFFRGQKR